jgi:hypothetical protein
MMRKNKQFSVFSFSFQRPTVFGEDCFGPG